MGEGERWFREFEHYAELYRIAQDEVEWLREELARLGAEVERLRAEREDLISLDDAFVRFALNPRYSE